MAKLVDRAIDDKASYYKATPEFEPNLNRIRDNIREIVNAKVLINIILFPKRPGSTELDT